MGKTGHFIGVLTFTVSLTAVAPASRAIADEGEATTYEGLQRLEESVLAPVTSIPSVVRFSPNSSARPSTHIRASTGTPIQQTNCHPFCHGRWLWMHNGSIRAFDTVKRDLAFAVDPSLYAAIEGSTDSELFFYLALTFGLEDDPPAAVERAVGFIEETGRARGVEHPVQMTVATTDGKSVWVFRYSSERQTNTLFYSTAVETLRSQYPDNPVFRELSDETRLVVSEPLSDLAGAWNEVSEATCGLIHKGQDELRPFTPRAA